MDFGSNTYHCPLPVLLIPFWLNEFNIFEVSTVLFGLGFFSLFTLNLSSDIYQLVMK